MRAVLLCCACLAAAPVLHAATLSLQDAIAKVERDTHGKVLSAETKRTGNGAVYRIKVLTRDGRVQVIEVPAEG
ncbi:MAG TPA: PepSY domain-containing protein [Rudaea sp.]|nr:PepSY domain-containing protein [Rudaea sp.]